MRPRSLEIEGLTVFRERQTIDFSDLGLFAITGPNGAGKTTLLDGISLALYGKVPRLDGGGRLGELICHGLPAARVQLDFTVNGGVYRVTRTLTRSGNGDIHQRAKLDRLDRPETLVARDGLRAVNTAIQELVKLDFDSFRRAVVLPQGEFAAFLKGDVRSRRETLIALLGLDHYKLMGKRARDQAAALQIEATEAERLITSEFADATVAELHAATITAQDAERHAETLRHAAEAARDLSAQRSELTSTARQIGELSDQARALAERLAAEQDTHRDAQRAAAAAHARHAAARERTRQTGEAYERLQEIRLTVEQEVGPLDALMRLQAAIEVLPELERRQREAAAAVGEVTDQQTATRTELREIALVLPGAVDQARDALRVAREELRDAQQNVTARQEQVTAVEHRHAAAALTTGLGEGDPCPVCDRPLAAHPPVEQEAANALRDAQDTLRGAQEVVERVRTTTAGAQATCETADRATRSVTPRLTATLGEPPLDAQTAMLLPADETGAGVDLLCQRAARLLDRLDLLTDSHAQSLRHLQHAQSAHDEQARLLHNRLGTTSALQAARRLASDRQRVEAAAAAAANAAEHHQAAQHAAADADRLAQEGTRRLEQLDRGVQQEHGKAGWLRAEAQRLPGPEIPDLPDAGHEELPDQLAAWAATTRGLLASLGEQIAERGRALDRHETSLAAEHELTGVAPTELLGRLEVAAAAAMTSTGSAVARVEQIEDKLRRRTDLEAEIRDKRERVALLGTLARELQSDRFIEFVAQQTLDLLAAHASRELRLLSSERFSLVSEAGEFSVIDHHNADERRSVRTLSGGEMFMAALSLALALSQHVTDLAGERLGARLEAVFIDEGFGSLDQEDGALDVVLGALGRLQDSGMLIGVISHVSEVAARISDGLEVKRNGAGSIVIRRGHRPAEPAAALL